MSKEVKYEKNASPNSINKERLLKKKSLSRNYKIWNEKFTTMAQLQIWTGRRNNHQTWRQVNRDYLVWGTEGKKNEEKEQNLRDFWDIINNTKTHIWEFQKEKKERGRKNILRNNDQKLPKFDGEH